MNDLTKTKKNRKCQHCQSELPNVSKQRIETGFAYEQVDLCLNCWADYDYDMANAKAEAAEYSNKGDYFRQFGIYL